MKKRILVVTAAGTAIVLVLMAIPALRAWSERAERSRDVTIVRSIFMKMCPSPSNPEDTFVPADPKFRAMLTSEEYQFLTGHKITHYPVGTRTNDLTCLEVKTRFGTIVQSYDGSTYLKRD